MLCIDATRCTYMHSSNPSRGAAELTFLSLMQTTHNNQSPLCLILCCLLTNYLTTNLYRQERHVLFQRELAERETEDVLERALLKAHNSKLNGAIPAADYFRLEEKIESLKKLRFTDEYERLQDPETYEFMKYKVAAEVGGPEEVEAYRLYERTRISEVGRDKYRLFAQRAQDDPIFQGYLQ